MQHSEFEHDHHLEGAILERIDSEGLVLVRIDKTWGLDLTPSLNVMS